MELEVREKPRKNKIVMEAVISQLLKLPAAQSLGPDDLHSSVQEEMACKVVDELFLIF